MKLNCKPETKKEKKIRQRCEVETMNARNELQEFKNAVKPIVEHMMKTKVAKKK